MERANQDDKPTVAMGTGHVTEREFIDKTLTQPLEESVRGRLAVDPCHQRGTDASIKVEN